MQLSSLGIQIASTEGHRDFSYAQVNRSSLIAGNFYSSVYRWTVEREFCSPILPGFTGDYIFKSLQSERYIVNQVTVRIQ